MLFAFKRVRRIEKESVEEYMNRPAVVITFEELEDHALLKLGAGQNTSQAVDEIAGNWFKKHQEGIRWLEEQLHTRPVDPEPLDPELVYTSSERKEQADTPFARKLGLR